MGLRNYTTTALSNDTDGIVEAETLSGAGSFTLGGTLVSSGVGYAPGNSAGVYTQGQLVTITSVGNDSGIDWTVTGINADGQTITETGDAANAGAATTTLYFAAITDVSMDGATANDVTVGFTASDGAQFKTIPLNDKEQDFSVTLSILRVSGSTNATVRSTPDSQNIIRETPTTVFKDTASWSSVTNLSNISASTITQQEITIVQGAVDVLISGDAAFEIWVNQSS